MKKTAIFLVMFYFSFLGLNLLKSQTTHTWTAILAGSASNGLNWSSLTTPAAGDNVVFDGSSTVDCTWDIPTINSFSVLSGYTGSISMGSAGRTIRNNFVINSGTVTSTSATLTRNILGVNSSFILGAGGTFNHNNGTFLLQLESTDNYTFSGDIVLNNLSLGGAFTPGERSINFGTNLSVNAMSFSGAVDPVSFQGTVHVKTSLNFSAATYTDALTGAHTANFIFDGTSASITGPSAAGRAWLPNLEINTSGTYTMAGNLNVLGNWTGTQGTLSLGTSAVNMYGASAAISGTAAAFDDLAIQSGANVSMPASTEVKIGGALTHTAGTLSFQATSALGLNGSGTQNIDLTGVTLAGIKAYNSGGSRNVSISGNATVLDSLKVESNVTFNTGSALTLRSTSALKARIAERGTNSTINGNVTVETFIPGGTTGWANLGVAGVDGQIVKSWDTHSLSAGANGIPMTCEGCDYDVTGIGSYFESIQGWLEPTSEYDTTITANTSLTPGQGFWVYVGDGQSATSDLTLINTGSVVQGNVTVPVSLGTGTAAGLNLIANPYACPISWTSVMSGAGGANALAVNDVIYVWNADLGQTTSYVSSTGVSSHNPNAGGISDIIPAGQGFYVEAEGTIPQLVFEETNKTFSVTGNTGANPLLRPSASSGGIQSFRLKLAGGYDWDETAFCIHPDGTMNYDKKFDAKKIFGSPGYVGYPGKYTKYTTISSRDGLGLDYSINTLPLLIEEMRIPVRAKVSVTGTYTIELTDVQNLNTCVGLIDKVNGSYHDLKQTSYVFAITDTVSEPRFELVLCKDPSINLASVAELNTSADIFINQDEQGAYVKTAFKKNTSAVISAYNIVGQKLMEDVEVEGTNLLTHLKLNAANQVVLIRVTTGQESVTKKMVMH